MRQPKLEYIAAPPWDACVDMFIGRPLEFDIEPPPPGAREWLELNAYTLRSGVHWFIFHTWSSRWRHPKTFDRKVIAQTKEFGLWLKHLRRLCMECHDFECNAGREPKYKNATELFATILAEFAYFGITDMILALYFTYDERLNATQSRKLQAMLSKTVSSFKNVDQPKLPLHTDTLAFSWIMARAVKMAYDPKIDRFRKEVFTPFVKQTQLMSVEMASWRLHSFDDDGNFQIQAGRGGFGKKTLNLPPEAPNTQRLEPIQGKGFSLKKLAYCYLPSLTIGRVIKILIKKTGVQIVKISPHSITSTRAAAPNTRWLKQAQAIAKRSESGGFLTRTERRLLEQFTLWKAAQSAKSEPVKLKPREPAQAA